MKKRKIYLLFASVFLLIWTGCSSQRMVPKTPVVGEHGARLSPDSRQIPEYTMGFGDVLEIKFFNNERFNELVSVRPDGRITLQRIGDILVNGMTPTELDSLITRAYSEIILNPDVTVFVREFGGNQVYVLGEVNSPGGFPIQQNMNVLQALASAGGIKPGAKLSSIMILRKREDGEIMAQRVDVKSAMKGRQGSGRSELEIRPQDIVFVPKTFISSVSGFMKQVYDGVLPPLDSYIRFLYWSRY